MRNVKNIYVEIVWLIIFTIPFCFITYGLITNFVHGTTGIVDVMVLMFDLVLASSIYLQISTIRLYVWLIRKKSSNMTSDD